MPAKLTLLIGEQSNGQKTAALNLCSSSGGISCLALTGSGEIHAGVVESSEAGITAWPNPMTDSMEVGFGYATPSMEISVVSSTGSTVATGTFTMVIRYVSTVVAHPLVIIRYVY